MSGCQGCKQVIGCEDCAAKDKLIAELLKALRNQSPATIIYQPVQSATATAPSHYDRCSCNPANGGSGICNCVLSGATITC